MVKIIYLSFEQKWLVLTQSLCLKTPEKCIKIDIFWDFGRGARMACSPKFKSQDKNSFVVISDIKPLFVEILQEVIF